MPDDDEEVVDNVEDEETEETDDETEDDADESADDDESSDSDTAGGSGAAEGEKPDAAVASVAPKGEDLIKLLAGDTEAQSKLASTFQQMMLENARAAEAQEQAKEFQELIDKGDFAEVGKRIVERQQVQATRESVADEVLKEVFQPVYAELFSQPEIKELSAEERQALDPKRFASDAHYVRALTEHIAGKRFSKAVDAEVQKRLKTAQEAEANRKTAEGTRTKSIAGTPAASAAGSGRASSGDLIRRGLSAAFGGGSSDDGDED